MFSQTAPSNIVGCASSINAMTANRIRLASVTRVLRNPTTANRAGKNSGQRDREAQEDIEGRAVHHELGRIGEHEWDQIGAPAQAGGDPSGLPLVGLRDGRAGESGERDRRRHHAEDSAEQHEHVRLDRGNAGLGEGRSGERREDHIDPKRRQRQAEHKRSEGGNEQQQSEAAAAEADDLLGQRKSDAGDVHRPDENSGDGGDGDNVDDRAARGHDCRQCFERADAAPFVRNHQGQADQNGGREQRGVFRLEIPPQQAVNQHEKRDREVPSSAQRLR